MERILLDRNENQYGPSPACYEVLRGANLAQMSLYSRAFTQGKKSELSDRLSRDFGIPEERVLLSYGSEDMLKQVVHCYLKEGETILLPQQSWWYYKSVAAEVSGKSVTYTIHEQGDRFAYDVQEMADLYDAHKPKIILIASPSNPTGNSMDPDDLSRLVRHCSSSMIVLDEAYYGFGYSTQAHPRELLSHHGQLVILRTFSKYFALAGLRIGYAFVGTECAKLVKFSSRYLGYNQLTEKIALAALDSPDYYKETAQAIKEDNAAYYQFFTGIPGFKPFRTEANFILARYPLERKAEIRTGLEAKGVIVKFLDDPGLEDCIRITTGTREQNRRVISAFQALPGELTSRVRAGSSASS